MSHQPDQTLFSHSQRFTLSRVKMSETICAPDFDSFHSNAPVQLLLLLFFSRIFINNILKYCYRFHIPEIFRSRPLQLFATIYNSFSCHSRQRLHLISSDIEHDLLLNSVADWHQQNQMCISVLDQFDLPEQIEYSILFFNAPTEA